MLHLLLLILKIAGIILAIILGILIVLLCIVLFVPVCYQVSGKTDGTEKGTKVRCKVTWLFSLLELKILYGNKSSVFSARIAGSGSKEERDQMKKKGRLMKSAGKSMRNLMKKRKWIHIWKRRKKLMRRYAA